MKILYVSSEVVPFAKTGGLADVAGALPLALKKFGHDVRVATPKYLMTDDEKFGLKSILNEIKVHFQFVTHYTKILSANFPGTDIPVYFVQYNPYFGREGLYTETGSDYPDNAQRFALFCIATLWMLRALEWNPDIIHCNDWQTALIPAHLKHHPDLRFDEFYNRIKVLYTIHNLAYQGRFDHDTLEKIGLGWEVFTIDGMEYYSDINLMKAGIVFSDEITTVSETYAKEIQTPEFGCGLDGVLRCRADHLTGIMNGIDYNVWNPAVDELIPGKFSPQRMAGKTKCKKALQEKNHLPQRADVPLIGMISRMADQKGFDLIAQIAPQLFSMDIQFILLGTGETRYHEMFEKIGKDYPEKAGINVTFDNRLAHEIEAGADMFLMPSRFEPCGLNQLYSLKYGTVPIVRKTGGLADSIIDATPETIANGTGTGFVFEEYTPEALLGAIRRALESYQKNIPWKKIQANGMTQDYSWGSSAKKYETLYQKMLGG
ncbi:MAG: glycogen synthase GlgA [Candidatus Sumerlaeota bacterium]|nr:glycogen synthase GlgA [Candidatus Sumerlaeota bacterium]